MSAMVIQASNIRSSCLSGGAEAAEEGRQKRGQGRVRQQGGEWVGRRRKRRLSGGRLRGLSRGSRGRGRRGGSSRAVSLGGADEETQERLGLPNGLLY